MVSTNDGRYRFTFVGGGRVSTIGGIVRTIAEIANELSDAGHMVRVIANGRADDAPYYTYRKKVAIDIAAYPYSDGKIDAFRKLLAKPVSGAPSDVIVIMASNRLAQNLIEAAAGLPSVIVRSEHGDPQSLLYTIWDGKEKERRATFEKADRSHLLFSDFAHQPDLGERIRSRQIYIPAPVRIPDEVARCEAPAADGRFRLVSAGRIETFEKNSGLLLDAFAGIANKYPDWDLHFYGDGGLRAELEKRSLDAGLSDRIVFHGSINTSTLSKELLKASLFAIPSDSEGCPMALGEALAHGVPAVGFSDCEGVSRTIRHGVNGLLAFPFALAHAEKTTNGGFNEAQAQFEHYEKKNVAANYMPSKDRYDDRISLFSDCLTVLMSNHELRAHLGAQARNSLWDREHNFVMNAWRQHLVGFAENRQSIVAERDGSLFGKNSELNQDKSSPADMVPFATPSYIDGIVASVGRMFPFGK